jgi:hypothetical protein
MTAPRKPDYLHMGLFLEELLAQDEAERLEKLSDEELSAELQRHGLDPHVPDEDEIRAQLAAFAAARGTALRWDTGEPAPSAASSFPRLEPLEPSSVRPAPAGDPARSPRARRIHPRTSRVLWLIAAALGVALVVLLVRERRTIMAWLEPLPTITPDDHHAPGPPPRELAAKLRHDAHGNCAFGDWKQCAAMLDLAKELDPAGEADPEVQAERKQIEEGTRPRPDVPRDQKP